MSLEFAILPSFAVALSTPFDYTLFFNHPPGLELSVNVHPSSIDPRVPDNLNYAL